MNIEITELKKFEDERGFLIEFLKGIELDKDNKEFGHLYIATMKPNCIRGNHYHETKFEILTILSGKAQILLEDPKTKEKKEIIIDADKDAKLKRIKIGSYTAHVVKNISNSSVVVVSYTNQLYNSKTPDDKRYTIIEK